jgi:hypothetical protein
VGRSAASRTESGAAVYFGNGTSHADAGYKHGGRQTSISDSVYNHVIKLLRSFVVSEEFTINTALAPHLVVLSQIAKSCNELIMESRLGI